MTLMFEPGTFADAELLTAEAVAAILTPTPPVDLGEWIEGNIVFGNDEPFPGPYRLDRFPFFRRILDVLGPEHPAREVTLRKSAQIGGTVLGDGFVLGWLDKAPTTLMVVHPTLPQGRLWVNNKVKPKVRASVSLQAILSFDNPGDAKATELLFERLDSRGKVIVTGANSAASLSQHTVRAQVQDDLDKWELNSGGDPEDQADSRSQAIEDAKIFKVSTPLVEGSSRIDANFKAGTQEHYHVPCPQCRHMQPLDWPNMQANIDAALTAGRPAASGAFFGCGGCGFPIEEKHRAWCVDPENGADWVAHNPGAPKVSFHLWTVYAPLMGWARVAERYAAAKGEPAKEKTFLNDVAGLTYRMAGEAPEWSLLKERADAGEFQRGRIAAGFYFLLAGVDVQLDRVEVGLWAFGPDLRRQAVDHRVIAGNIAQDATKAALSKLLTEERWPDAYGNPRGIEHLAIDVGYEREHCLDWVRRHPAHLVTPVVGALSDNAPIFGTHQTRDSKLNGKRVRADRPVFPVGGSVLKGFLYADLRKSDPLERGFVALPAGFDAAWFEQLASERREPTKNKRGFTVYRWVLPAGQRNEVLDVAVYAHAAAQALGWRKLTDAQWQAVAAERDRVPETQGPDLFTPDRSVTVRPAPPPAAAPRVAPRVSADWLGGADEHWRD